MSPCSEDEFSKLLYSFFSFSLNDDRNKCGQTSRLVAGAEIRARCNSETNLCNCCHHLGFSITAGISHFINYRVAGWCSYGVVSLCIITATLSYIKIFCALRQNHLRGQVFFLPQPGKPVPLNMIRYRKAVNSALWVQLALIVCYLPYSIATGLFQSQNELSSLEFVVLESTVTLVYLNSSLNPFLYCWKIAEVRKAVKETISKALSSLLGYSIQNN